MNLDELLQLLQSQDFEDLHKWTSRMKPWAEANTSEYLTAMMDQVSKHPEIYGVLVGRLHRHLANDSLDLEDITSFEPLEEEYFPKALTEAWIVNLVRLGHLTVMMSLVTGGLDGLDDQVRRN